MAIFFFIGTRRVDGIVVGFRVRRTNVGREIMEGSGGGAVDDSNATQTSRGHRRGHGSHYLHHKRGGRKERGGLGSCLCSYANAGSIAYPFCPFATKAALRRTADTKGQRHLVPTALVHFEPKEGIPKKTTKGFENSLDEAEPARGLLHTIQAHDHSPDRTNLWHYNRTGQGGGSGGRSADAACDIPECVFKRGMSAFARCDRRQRQPNWPKARLPRPTHDVLRV